MRIVIGIIIVFVFVGIGYAIWFALLNMPLSPPSEEVFRYEFGRNIQKE